MHTRYFRVALVSLLFLSPLFGASPSVLTGDTLPFECDVTHRNSIDDPIERDYFVFSAVDDERIHITFANVTPAGPNFGVVWRLLKSDGTSATECGDASGAARDCGRLRASESPYRVEVSDFQSNDTGAYLIHLQRLAAAVACENIPLACSVTYPGTIDSQVDTDLLSFSVMDGERVNITFANSVPAGPNFGVVWRLLKGDGAPASPCGDVSGAARDCGPLPASGNPYRIEVSDFQFNGSGAYLFHLQRLTAGAACPLLPLNCDVTVTRALESPVDTDLHSFSVADGERVSITFANSTPAQPNFGVVWRLLKGDGTPASVCGDVSGAARDCGALPASGNPYRIEISDFQFNAAGNYLLHLQRLTAAAACDNLPLLCGVTSPGLIDSVIDTDLHSFSVPEGERVNINFSNGTPAGPNFGVVWRLLKGDGTPASTCGEVSGTNRDCGPLPASGNPYRVEFFDFQYNGAGAYSVVVNFLTTGCPAITFSPNPWTVAVGTNGRMTVFINNPQTTDTVVMLLSSNPGIAKVPATVTIPPNRNSASFEVMGISAGSATLTATLPPNLGSPTATAMVTVFNPGVAQIELIPPAPTTNDQVRAGISGSWPNSCTPLNPEVTTAGNEIRITTTNAGQGCTQVTTGWSHLKEIGQLQAGDYSVIVSFNGAEIGRRNFSVTPPANLRTVRVVSVNASPGSTVNVPIELTAIGDENALGFTLSFDRSVLSNPQAALGTDAPGAALNQNSSQAEQGRFGVTLSLPAGQRFAAGARRALVVSFTVAAGAMTLSEIGFADQPIVREVAGVRAEFLSTAFVAGKVVIPGYEADVMPRPDVNNVVTMADWVQVGRFAAALDATVSDGEYQRADCAPRLANDGGALVRGNGLLTVADWVQAGRYAAGLDPATPAGGSSGRATFAPVLAAEFGGTGSDAVSNVAARLVRAVRLSSGPGQNIVFSIELEAQGSENALGFSINFDPGRWRFVSMVAGGDATGAAFNTNDRQAAAGQVGLALALATGQAWPAGIRRLAVFTFSPVSSGLDAATISFSDQPVTREAVDIRANALPTAWAPSAVTSVSAASFRGPELASETLAAAFGSNLAMGTEVASNIPLPTALAGASIKVRDSAGKEALSSLLFASPVQINYQIPPAMAPGPATVSVIGGNDTFAIGTVTIATISPGLFSANADGQGIAAAVVLRVKADGTQIFEPVARFDSSQNKFVAVPIDLGQESDQVFLIPFGTGFRFRNALSAVTVRISGVDAPVLYAGEAPGFVGLDQLNVRLSRELVGRAEVDVVLTVEGKTANVVQVNIK
jgi:uncharacterized protein (TIGR03437 family)